MYSCLSLQFIYFHCYIVFLHVDMQQPIALTLDGHLGHFQIRTIMPAVHCDVCVWVRVGKSFSRTYTWSGLAGSQNMSVFASSGKWLYVELLFLHILTSTFFCPLAFIHCAHLPPSSFTNLFINLQRQGKKLSIYTGRTYCGHHIYKIRITKEAAQESMVFTPTPVVQITSPV